MQVKVLNECGYEEALRGMSFSYKDRESSMDDWWKTQYDKAAKRAELLAFKCGGHNKFLESIQVWIEVEATRAWWSEADTYRVGITKQSESTMHTLSKRPPNEADFEEGTPMEIINCFCSIFDTIKDNVNALKKALPEGFLQRRLICTNYKALQNIYYQRKGRRLAAWDQFLEQLLSQLGHPEFIKND